MTPATTAQQDEQTPTQAEQREHTSAATSTQSVVTETPMRKDVMEVKQLAQERENRMREREQMLSQERKWRQNRVPGSGALPELPRIETSETTPTARPKPMRRVKDPRLDRERPLYRDYDRDKENTWQGGSVEVKEIFQDRVIQAAIGALVVCLIVVIIVLATTQYNQNAAPTAWLGQFIVMAL